MNVLCVVAHPDDEVLGCGGALAKHAEAGDTVGICYGTGNYLDERAAARQIIGASDTWVACFMLPDQRFDTRPLLDMTQLLESWSFQPNVVYTHNPDDLNQDHALTAKAVLTAFRAPHSQADILAFETLSSTEFGPAAFQPNHWEVLTWDQVNKKTSALCCYRSELKPYPHPRNVPGVKAQARWRGQQICQPYAEAFRILRSIR